MDLDPITYKRAWGAARQIDPSSDNPLELVHTAFIRYYNRTGQNLFEKPMSYIYATMRNIYLNFKVNDHRYMVDGEFRYRSFVDIDERNDQDVLVNDVTDPSAITDSMISSDLQDNYRKHLSNLSKRVNGKNVTPSTLDVYDLMIRGEGYTEIVKATKKSKSSVSRHMKAIRTELSYVE